MDKGEFVRNGYTAEPGDGGSWIVYQGRKGEERYMVSAIRGFTDHSDLVHWLIEEHGANALPPSGGTPAEGG
jgi:hypothetical protein